MLQRKGESAMYNITIGMDIGDQKNQIHVLNVDGETTKICRITNTQKAIEEFFCQYPGALVAIEACSHSPWISRILKKIVAKVLVGNPRKLRMIWASDQKDDVRDAEMLARIARLDASLLYPINHKGEQNQADRALLKARDILVKTRSSLILHVRGSVKSMGGRVVGCSSASFHKNAAEYIPDLLKLPLAPILKQIEDISMNILEYDKAIKKISLERYPATEILQQVGGVGPVTALAYVVTIEDPANFPKSRDVGPYLGMTPRRDQSGDSDKQLRITKAGDRYMRRLLVQSAHYILGAFGEDSNLRRFGLRLAERGGKNAKRRAVVAVARKLAVLLHRLWITGEVYEPLYKPAKVIMKEAA
jgi:transposase